MDNAYKNLNNSDQWKMEKCKNVQSGKYVYDVTLACDDKQTQTSKLGKTSETIDSKIEMDNIYTEKDSIQSMFKEYDHCITITHSEESFL